MGVKRLFQIFDMFRIQKSDVVMDLGGGTGRAVIFMHLLGGAEGISIEQEDELVREGIALCNHNRIEGVRHVCADVARADLTGATVYLMYNPFTDSEFLHDTLLRVGEAGRRRARLATLSIDPGDIIATGRFEPLLLGERWPDQPCFFDVI